MSKKIRDAFLLAAMTGAFFVPFAGDIVLAQETEGSHYTEGAVEIRLPSIIVPPVDAYEGMFTTLIPDDGESPVAEADDVETLRAIYLALTGATPGEINLGTYNFAHYNTNYLLGGGNIAARDYNLLYLVGGPMDHTGVDRQPNAIKDPVTYNTNSLLQNAFMGDSASGFERVFETYMYEELPENGALVGIDLGEGEVETGERNVNLIMYDRLLTGERAIYDGAVRSAFPVAGGNQEEATTEVQLQRAYFNFRCINGFNPYNLLDDEGQLNVREANCLQRPAHVRKDRTLNSLLEPLQYLAPPEMPMAEASLHANEPTYVRFPEPITAVGEEYYPIYAAAGFCMGLMYASQTHVPSLTQQNAAPTLNATAWRETIDGKMSSDCWHFFEERVQYGADSARVRDHYTQYMRCVADRSFHIISEGELEYCEEYGRSSLKARADAAYRAYSQEYLNYLNTLGVVTRELLLASALTDAEKFEEYLMLERQIMSAVMVVPNRDPFEKITDKERNVYTQGE